MDIAVAYKDAYNMTTFYSRYNSLAKDQPQTEYTRAVRQTVLDMIIEYNKSGTTTKIHDEVAAICKQQGSTELMPSVMNTYITDDSGRQYQLTAAQYVEYQTNYNRLYWRYVEDALSSANTKDAAYKAAIVKAAKARARTEATGSMLALKGAKLKDYNLAKSFESQGIDSTEHILFMAALDIANDDGNLKQSVVIDVIESIEGLTDQEKYYLFKSRNDSDKNNPWANNK